MTQQNKTMNFLIHDVNGCPQVIKVVQSTPNKNLSGIMGTTNTGGPIKVFKTPGQETHQVLSSGQQVLRTISLQSPSTPGQRLVTIPIQNAKVSSVKPIEGMMTKTIQLTPAQMNDIKQAIVSQQQQQTSGQQQQIIKDGTGKTFVTPLMDHHALSRKRHDTDGNEYVPDKRRKTEKVGKGLRHFSMKVCEKVKKKGTTSYNEVADELVGEFTNPSHANEQYDQKNIRRRVYDALNVLMAMNIISKEKKEIRWLGLPTNSIQECNTLEKDKKKKIERIKAKTQQLHQLILQHISFKNLVERNCENENKYGPPKPNSAIQLPFIILNTSKKTVVDCSITNDKSEYLFNFNDKFEIHDDIEVLKRMGLAFGLEKGECTEDNLQKAKAMVPESLQKYVEQLASGDLEKFIPVTFTGPSTSMDELDMKLEASSRPPSSSRTSLSEEALSPQSQYCSEEEEEEEDMEDFDHDEHVGLDSDVDIN